MTEEQKAQKSPKQRARELVDRLTQEDDMSDELVFKLVNGITTLLQEQSNADLERHRAACKIYEDRAKYWQDSAKHYQKKYADMRNAGLSSVDLNDPNPLLARLQRIEERITKLEQTPDPMQTMQSVPLSNPCGEGDLDGMSLDDVCQKLHQAYAMCDKYKKLTEQWYNDYQHEVDKNEKLARDREQIIHEMEDRVIDVLRKIRIEADNQMATHTAGWVARCIRAAQAVFAAMREGTAS